MAKRTLYVGDWGFRDGKPEEKAATRAIAICEYDEETGSVSVVKSTEEQAATGVLLRVGDMLYATDEMKEQPGQPGSGGRVLAWKICRGAEGAGDLTLVSAKPSFGANTTYVAVTPDRRYLAVTNLSSFAAVTRIGKDAEGNFVIVPDTGDSTLVLYRLEEDGSIGRLCDVYVKENIGGCEAFCSANLHSVAISPVSGMLAACDMGMDQVGTWRINRETETIEPVDVFRCKAGMGPRYCAFHPTLPYLFVNYEKEPYVASFACGEDGALTEISTVPIVGDEDFGGEAPKQAGMALSPDGRFLYTLIRGIQAVAVFRIDQASGALTRLQTLSYGGEHPKICAVSPDGRFLLVASARTKDVISLPIGPDGTLTAPGSRTGISTSPAGIAFS